MLRKKKVLSLLGTRPEVIKFAPILQRLERSALQIYAVNIVSGQHTHLLYPLVRYFHLRIHHQLSAIQRLQTSDALCDRIVQQLLPILDREQPDLILVQGDTATALAGSVAGRMRCVPIGHIEAGLRSGDLTSPFPEEANRRIISQLATYHFAPTFANRELLIREGIARQNIFVTGNPGVDSILAVLRNSTPTSHLLRLLAVTRGFKRIVLTTHRRESFGHTLEVCFRVLRRFVEVHENVAMIFPMHPNPALSAPASILRGHPRIHVIGAMIYPDFVHLMSQASLIISDSGGVQEEVPSLGRPLLILRKNTERPEAVECGVARLAGTSAESFSKALDDSSKKESWTTAVQSASNPFGRGDSGSQIVDAIHSLLGTGAN